MPRVSVIIPCYNQGKYIDEAVKSVLSQTFQDFEIIIINDGSTDKFTNKLLGSCQYPKTKIIKTLNRGTVSARNTGIRSSRGDYILPLDADDKIGKEYLEEAVKILDKNLEIGIVYCNALLFGGKRGRWKLQKYSLENILLGNMIFCSALFRKKDWGKTGGYNSNMKNGYEDWDFWLSLIEQGVKVYKIPKVLFHYRIQNSGKVNKMTEKEKLDVRTQIFYNHERLYRNNIRYLLKRIDTDNIKNSWSYKIGRIITKPLSKLIY